MLSARLTTICMIQGKSYSLKKSVVSAEKAAVKAKAELKANAETKLTLVDGQCVFGENPLRLKRLKANAGKTKEEEVRCTSLWRPTRLLLVVSLMK